MESGRLREGMSALLPHSPFCAGRVGPGAASQGPEAASQGPGAASQGPGAASQGPGAASHCPGAASQGPGAASQGPGAASQGPGAATPFCAGRDGRTLDECESTITKTLGEQGQGEKCCKQYKRSHLRTVRLKAPRYLTCRVPHFGCTVLRATHKLAELDLPHGGVRIAQKAPRHTSPG